MSKSAALRAHQKTIRPFWEFWKHHLRLALDIVGVVIVGAAIISVIAQFLFPADMALPLTKIGGMEVGLKQRAEITATLADYAQAGEVTVKTPSRQWQAKWQTVGVSIDHEASADSILNYEPWERAIPFSAVAKVLQSRDLPLIAIADSDRLDSFANQLVKEDALAARDATIKVANGEVLIDAAKNGYVFSADDVKNQIRSAAVGTNTVLELRPQVAPPVRSEQSLRQLKAEAEQILQRSPVLKVAGREFIPSRAEIGGWLLFADDPESKTVKLQFNTDAVKAYLENINREIKIEPGTSTVTLLDGQEVARTPASSGRSVALDATVEGIISTLRGATSAPQIDLPMASVPPKVNYVQTYSKSSAGLQAIINDWEKSNYGEFGILVRELGGEMRYAEWQPDKQFVTASTFKIFVYYALQQKIQAGEISYSQITDMGWTVEDCVEEMIVRSTNPCAISLLNLIGWQQAQDYVVAAGFSSTHIHRADGGHKVSTVRDETNYMMRLNAGTLMGQEATSRLLGYLKRQIWRAGIPSGVPRGVVVANKVGFYDGWVHDIAIVYAPKGTYILGVMSKGGSDPQFAELSRRVYQFFNN